MTAPDLDRAQAYDMESSLEIVLLQVSVPSSQGAVKRFTLNLPPPSVYLHSVLVMSPDGIMGENKVALSS